MSMHTHSRLGVGLMAVCCSRRCAWALWDCETTNPGARNMHVLVKHMLLVCRRCAYTQPTCA
jgi:hypothetical protein